MRDENPTVYSTASGRMCPKCGKPLDKCVCKSGANSLSKTKDGIARLFRESKGRKGKTVTLIKELPLNQDDMRELLTDLKRMCGCGGSVKDGVMEIQGDHRELILAELKKRGHSAKIAGG